MVRAWAIARHKPPGGALADEEATPLAAVGGLILWLLRLALAPASTLAGFRAWVLEECPVAPGRRAPRPAAAVSPAAAPAAIRPARPRTARARETKTARFLALVAERHGPLAAVPLAEVSKICAELAPQAGLNTGAARTALRRAVLAAQDGAAPVRYVIALAVLLVLAALWAWAFLPAPPPARQPGPAPAAAAAPAAAPGPGVRHRVRAVAAVGPVRRVPPVRPDPPLARRRGSGCARPADAFGAAWAGRTTGTGCGCRWKSTCW